MQRSTIGPLSCERDCIERRALMLRSSDASSLEILHRTYTDGTPLRPVAARRLHLDAGSGGLVTHGRFCDTP